MTTMAATAHSSPTSPEPRLGLRERKKIKTRMAIRKATYRLVQEQGYDATTIEQIAEAAEVSPSTVFRYFPPRRTSSSRTSTTRSWRRNCARARPTSRCHGPCGS